MKKSDILSVALKLYGLNFLIDFLSKFVSGFGLIIFNSSPKNQIPWNGLPMNQSTAGFFMMANAVVFLGLGLFLLRYSAFIADKLLFKDNDITLSTKYSKEDILELVFMSVGVFFTGESLLATFPYLLKIIFIPTQFYYWGVAVSTIQLIIGVAFILGAKKLTKLVLKFSF